MYLWQENDKKQIDFANIAKSLTDQSSLIWKFEDEIAFLKG